MSTVTFTICASGAKFNFWQAEKLTEILVYNWNKAKEESEIRTEGEMQSSPSSGDFCIQQFEDGILLDGIIVRCR